MKTTESARKKVELRERFMKYACAHADNDRIPTVAEFRKALGVTNYMLLNCMKELVREGVIYRKSRKEGTFLSSHRKKYVIGLFDNDCAGNGFVDLSAWMSGFYRAFMRNEDILLRIVPCQKPENLPAAIRQFGLDSVVWYSAVKKDWTDMIQSFPMKIREKIICASACTDVEAASLPRSNFIGIDRDFWLREYVRAAVRRGCRNFLLVSRADRVSGIMLSEMKALGLTWHPECLISDPDELHKKLPELVKKYKVDAVRCAGGFQHSFAMAVKDMPDFRPFLPVFGSETMYRQMKKDYPWLNASFIFEHLDDFYERLGFLTGKAAIDLAVNDQIFSSVRIKMNYSREYKKELKEKEKRSGQSSRRL